MHIALYSPAWPPSTHPNGIVTYVRWLREGLHALGHRTTILTPILDSPENGVVLIPEEGPLPWHKSIAARMRGQRPTVFNSGRREIAPMVARLHERDPFDVVEMEESFGWAAQVSAATDVTLVVKLHGPAFLHLVDEELATSFGRERVRLEGEALAALPFIISPSRCHLRDTIARYRLQPAIAEHVTNPLALDESAPLWRLEGCERDTVLFVGRFDKVKGGDLVILAFQKVLRARPRTKLLFVGPDRGLIQANGLHLGFRQFVAQLSDPALEAAITYLGPLGREEIERLRVRSFCVLVTSRIESQGYTAVEAMLQGCPVVCVDNSGLSEVVVDGVTGLLARSENPDDIARQILRLFSEPNFAQSLGAAARRRARDEHAPDLVAARNVEIYKRAIAIRAQSRLPARRRAS